MDLVCEAKEGGSGTVKIATVGDSITAGVCSSSDENTYPSQLQDLLDKAHPNAFFVTNLGACGSTMQKGADSPYWDRPQFETLTSQEWDIIIIMLGTNDAKDAGSGGPDNWQHDCGGKANTTTLGCTFAEDYSAMIDLVQTLGNPKIYLNVPPPLMQEGSIGANQTVINSVFPALLPEIVGENSGAISGLIDVYSAMGGTVDWESVDGWPEECTVDDYQVWEECAYWCDKQSCDQCHPNDAGYRVMAQAVFDGLNLSEFDRNIGI